MQYLTRIKNFFIGLTNPYPRRDWYLVLSLAVLVILALVGVSVYFFIGIQSGFIVGGQPAPEDATPSISREGLSRTLDVYEVRTVNFNEGNYPVPDTADPSR